MANKVSKGVSLFAQLEDVVGLVAAAKSERNAARDALAAADILLGARTRDAERIRDELKAIVLSVIPPDDPRDTRVRTD